MDRFNGFLRRNPSKKTIDVTVEPVSETTLESKCQRWKPVTLRRPFLLAVILITLGLLVLVQVLVIYDQNHDGILFATKISELGAGHIFLYRYFPTIISVSYGLIWHWIDIDARRVEPYRQLSKPGGASGSNSLLLHYSTTLLAFVPWKALKRKHWPVVIASSALVLVGMGLTPLQAAIFATEKVTKTFSESMLLSKSHMSMADQASQITANYTYSVANIVWLDERLPPFMTREAAITPFKLGTSQRSHAGETWTAETTSYGVDVTCESAILDDDEKWSSSQGCHVPQSFGPGADVIGVDVSEDVVKKYTPFFSGFSGDGGNVNFYLEPYCPEKASHVFMIALRQNRKSADDPPAPMTRLFCETHYYQHNVTATIVQAGGSVVGITDEGPKATLSPGLFNTSVFEDQISNAIQQIRVRGVLPSSAWPDQRPQLAKLPITLGDSFQEMINIFGLAVGAYPRDSFDDYMDPLVLTTAVQAAHRLLFARAMVDVLADGYQETESVDGLRVYNTEAVRIVMRFAYAVEAVLGLVVLMVVTLMAVTWCDNINLRTDPDSLSALMLLVKGQPTILEQFSQHDQSSWELLKAETSGSTYVLEQPHFTQQGTLKLLNSPICTDNTRERRDKEDKPDFEYPVEFSMAAGLLFILVLLSALAATSSLFHASKGHGLALPTQDRFVRQVLENYIPTAIATLIEPVWVVLNRLHCLLQPFQALHGKTISARRSIRINYASKPPQFVLFKALGAKHFILSAICAMALLGNVLAVAFSGLLDEDTLIVAHQAYASSVYDARLKDHIANSTDYGNPANPFPFYSVMANFTSGTPMPLWTDDSAFYLPVSHEAQLNSSDQLQLSDASALAMDMQCGPIGEAHGSSWSFGRGSLANDAAIRTNVTVSLTNDQGQPLVCMSKLLFLMRDVYPWSCSSQQTFAVEYMSPLKAPEFLKEPGLSLNDDPCQGLLVGVWARKPASEMCDDEATFSEDDATVMICRTRVTVRPVNLTVTGDHLVLGATSEHPPVDFSGSQKLIKEASNAMWDWDYYSSSSRYQGGTWHNDSFPSDWHSYVMNLMDPDSVVLDPTLPPPDFDRTAALFTKSWQKLFAIWLGMNHERVLAESSEDSPAIEATILRPEIRIVVSRPMVVLSSTILGLYIIVAIAVYSKRPGKFLPRMPLTMASDIALFAASKAVAEIDEDERSKPELGADRKRFGYGSFIGTDGRPHVGVERAPFVVST